MEGWVMSAKRQKYFQKLQTVFVKEYAAKTGSLLMIPGMQNN